MEKEFVTYEIALKLKELGFNEECFGFFTYLGELRRYTNHDGDLNTFQTVKNNQIKMGDEWCCAPLWQQVIDWFIVKYNLYLSIFPYYNESGDLFWYNIVNTKEEGSCLFESDLKKVNNYHKSREQAILKTIELIKKMN